MANTTVALAMALVVSLSWVISMVSAVVLETVVMAVVTLIPLSVEDTDHLDSSEELDHYFETQNVCLIFII